MSGCLTPNKALQMTASPFPPLSLVVRRQMVFPIRKPLWKSAALYFVLSMIILCAWSAIGVFVLGEYEPEPGGPWENYTTGFRLSLAISAMSAMGYLVALQVFGRLLSDSSTDSRASIAVIAAVLFLVVGRTGVVGESAVYLPLGGVENLMLAFLMAGVFVGGIALFLVGFWSRARGAA